MYDIDIKDVLYFIVICVVVFWQNGLFYRQQIAYTSTCYSRNFKTVASLCSWAGWFESYLVENPEDRFSHVEAHMTFGLSIFNPLVPSVP